jgi:hypothetical protein
MQNNSVLLTPFQCAILNLGSRHMTFGAGATLNPEAAAAAAAAAAATTKH